MPQTFITWSDMQFDEANMFSGKGGWSSYPFIVETLKGTDMINRIELTQQIVNQYRQSFVTHHEILTYTYEKLGYKFPLQVYWNLRGDTTGSAAKSIFNGKLMYQSTPYDLFITSIECNRYNCIENEINESIKYITNESEYESYLKDSDCLWNIVDLNIT